MRMTDLLRHHVAALRALLALTAVTGLAYPLLVWGIAQLPGLHDKAEGSIVTARGKPVGSRLIGQAFTDRDGKAIPKYFQSRPSAAGDGYDPLRTSASNLGPEQVLDTPADPALLAQGKSGTEAGFAASLLTRVCAESVAVGTREGVDGSRPFCTAGGVGAVLSVIGPRASDGTVPHPTRVVSVNEPCHGTATARPFLGEYRGVRVECAVYGEDYAVGRIVPVRGNAPADPRVPADAVTTSAGGLDPDISPAYADLQIARVARARGVSPDRIRSLVTSHESGRTLGVFGAPRVNVVELNLALDRQYPVR